MGEKVPGMAIWNDGPEILSDEPETMIYAVGYHRDGDEYFVL